MKKNYLYVIIIILIASNIITIGILAGKNKTANNKTYNYEIQKPYSIVKSADGYYYILRGENYVFSNKRDLFDYFRRIGEASWHKPDKFRTEDEAREVYYKYLHNRYK